MYVAAISEKFLDRLSYRNRLYKLISDDFEQNYYDEMVQLRSNFEMSDIMRYHHEGFWEDARFGDIAALATNYQKWLAEERNKNGTW